MRSDGSIDLTKGYGRVAYTIRAPSNTIKLKTAVLKTGTTVHLQDLHDSDDESTDAERQTPSEQQRAAIDRSRTCSSRRYE